MKRSVTARPETLPSYTYRVETPDGTMFATIVELDNAPFELHIQIGKAGTPLRAWCSAMERLLSLCFRSGLPIISIIAEISGHTSSRWRSQKPGVQIRSGPEGLAYAIMRYGDDKRKERGDDKEINDSGPILDYGDFPEG